MCASVFRGLVFYLAREAPREALLLVIRAFGGTVGWQGEGSPLAEDDSSITHQVGNLQTAALSRAAASLSLHRCHSCCSSCTLLAFMAAALAR